MLSGTRCVGDGFRYVPRPIVLCFGLCVLLCGGGRGGLFSLSCLSCAVVPVTVDDVRVVSAVFFFVGDCSVAQLLLGSISSLFFPCLIWQMPVFGLDSVYLFKNRLNCR